MKLATSAQMRALQQLREGHLIIKTPSHTFLTDVSIEMVSGVGYLIPERTAKILIDRGWVTLTKFNAREGVYRLSAEGEELTEELCQCKTQKAKGKRQKQYALLSSVDPEATTPNRDWPNERLLCRRCWRRVPCEGKFFKNPHAANRVHGRLGPVCQKHYLKIQKAGGN